MRYFLIFSCLLVWSLLGMILTGCSNNNSYMSTERLNDFVESDDVVIFHARNHYHRGTYSQSIALLEQLSQKRTQNQPLILCELGTAYLAVQKKQEAKQNLSEAYRSLETFLNEGLEGESSSLKGENLYNVYQGQPYEHATLCLLMGLIHLEEGDAGKALEFFRQGQRVDSKDGPEQSNSDYGLLQLLEAKTYKILGETVQYRKSLDSAIRSFVLEHPAPNTLDEGGDIIQAGLQTPYNTLLLVWLGEAPVMVRAGEFGEKKVFVKNPWPSGRLEMSINNNRINGTLNTYTNISYQATTKGGQPLENVVNSLGDLKSNARSLGVASFESARFWGDTIPLTPADAQVKAFLYLTSFAVGLAAHSLSNAINARADIRCWRTLPDRIAIVPLQLESGNHNVAISYYNEQGQHVSVKKIIQVQEKPFQFFNLVVPASVNMGEKFL